MGVDESAKRSRFILFCLVSFSIAQFISILGDRLHQFSVVGMVGKVEPGSSLHLLLLAVFTHGPVLLFAPLFGSLIDRWHKGAVLVAADFFRGALVLFLPSLFLHFESLYAFFIPVALLTLANLFFSPAKSSIIPELVSESRLVAFNAMLWGIGIVGTIIGFLLGGWLFDYRSWQMSFYADAASYLISAVLLLPLIVLPRSRRADASAPPSARAAWGAPRTLITNIGASIKEGTVLIRRNRVVAVSLVTQTALFGLGGLLYVIAIAHIQDLSPPGNTMYLSAAAVTGTVGLLIGSLAAGAYKGELSSHHIVSIATIVIGMSLVGIARSDGLITLSIWTAALGAAASPVIIFSETLLQKHIPENFRGRVFSAREVLTKTSFLGLALTGTVLNVFIGKVLILLCVGLFLALLGVLLERKKLLRI
ncbi:MAG: MFS transporter [Chitinivibrionia bacterium]|nr:MFS transporter [Chitinivibrionia bacterium]